MGMFYIYRTGLIQTSFFTPGEEVASQDVPGNSSSPKASLVHCTVPKPALQLGLEVQKVGSSSRAAGQQADQGNNWQALFWEILAERRIYPGPTLFWLTQDTSPPWAEM